MQYRLVEVFASIQGEGLQAGRPATFIRLAGCNLRCPWCDTPESLTSDNKKILNLAELLAVVKERAKGKYVVITGGEPALHSLGPLVDGLHAEGFIIGLETNGTLPVEAAIDWLTLSPKPPYYQIDSSLIPLVKELKLVVDDNLTLDIARRLWTEVGKQVPVILQPESTRPEMLARILDWLTLEPQWRLGVQLHKIIGVQ